MPDSLNLNGTWLVSWTEGLHGRSTDVQPEPLDALRYFPIEVPCELHRGLVDSGLLEDPNLGLNSLKARWVEEQQWVYRTTLNAPEEALREPAWLSFDGLDLNAVVYLNGQEIGRHSNAHRPCRLTVTDKLRKGENTLCVVLESGLYGVADREGKAYSQATETLLNKRHWLRKAQYQAGWDWNPRLINVGIIGDVRLEWGALPWIDQLVALPDLERDLQTARLLVRAVVQNPGDATSGVLRVAVSDPGETRLRHGHVEVEFPPGESCPELTLQIEKPQLWWPVGHGGQPLYKVVAILDVGGRNVSERRKRTGIRRIEIDRSPHAEGGEHFALKVNGRPIFCKGGNWVPPDMIVPGVEEQRFRDLVDLAIEANFNLLRVWGGGWYASDKLLNVCDERGVLVWHDLAFACSKYPGDDPGFVSEVRQEVTWNARDMASHPSLVVWCGNNELEWGAWAWGYVDGYKALPDYHLYHHTIPVILKREDGSRPYWPSSPYSPDHQFPNEPTVGDQHPWSVSLGEHGPDFWAYRTFVDRFPNEGGVLGATSPATLRQCLGDELKFRSVAWEHHDNAANFWRPEEGITYRAVKFWLDRDPENMDLEQYCFASALLQAEGLSEYISNYRRRMFTSSSAIFWMYNDSWPATHGWTIVDYYLRRKLAYHPVRRAFQPITVVLAEEGDQVTVWGVNDTPEDWTGVLRHGLFRFDGATPRDETFAVTLPANMSAQLTQIPLKDWDKQGAKRTGAFGVLVEGERVVAQHRLLRERFKCLKLPRPDIDVVVENGVARFRSSGFVWGVCLDLDGEAPLADNAFDLLPGLEYTVPWPEGLEAPRILHTGNELVRQ
jgi:beta-mannosidase